MKYNQILFCKILNSSQNLSTIYLQIRVLQSNRSHCLVLFKNNILNFKFYSFLVLVALMLLKLNNTRAQEKFVSNDAVSLYFKTGFSFQFGSHQDRVGVNISSAIGQSYANITAQYQLLYTLKDFGFSKKSFQHIIGIKLSSAFQEGNTAYRPVAESPFSNHSLYQFHYFYRYYLNNWNTSQATGEIGISMGHFFLLHENDLLAAKSVDKYRTAAMRMGYQDSSQSVAASFIFWTGNKDHPKTKRFNSSDFSRYGYFDLSETPYGKYSHGILAIDYLRQLPFANQIRLSAGYDHEKIRNSIQNRFMHDLPIWPRKWNTAKSRHVPMVDEEGNSYLYQEDQELRTGKFYWGVFCNSSDFY